MATITDHRGNGPARAAGDRLRVDPSRHGQRRPRMAWIALGLLVALGFGLFGAVTLARVADRAPALALARDIERGEIIAAEDLVVVNVGAEDTVAFVEATAREELVGLTAASNMGAGTLVTRDQFTDGPVVAAGESVVGLALAPGEYPTASLRPGDRVLVVRTPDTAAPSARGDDEPVVLVDDAEVFAVETLSDTARTLMVSIAVPTALAPDIASAAAAGRIRLVLVGGS